MSSVRVAMPSRTATAIAARTLACLLAVGCSSAPPLPDPPRTHPASPAADEAPERAPSPTLVMPERRPPTSGGSPKRGH